MRRVAAVIFAILLTLPTVGIAQLTYPESLWDPEALATWVFPGMSEDWLRIPNVLYYVIFPFFTAFVVIYGILKELRIFRRAGKLNGVIAFCFAFLLLPSGILTYIVNIFYAFGAFVGLIGFGILFIIGVILWVYGTSFRLYGNFGGMAKEVSNIRGELTGVSRRRRNILNQIGKEVNNVVYDADVQHALKTSNPKEWPFKLRVGDNVPSKVQSLVNEYGSLSKKERELSRDMRKTGFEP